MPMTPIEDLADCASALVDLMNDLITEVRTNTYAMINLNFGEQVIKEGTSAAEVEAARDAMPVFTKIVYARMRDHADVGIPLINEEMEKQLERIFGD